MATEIILIGTHHYDPQGRKRLTRLLNHLKPDVVSIELTEQKMKDRERLEAERKRPEYHSELQWYARNVGVKISNIKFILETEGYEYYAARDYCQKQQIPLVPADPWLDEYFNSSEKLQTEVKRFVKLRVEEIEERVQESYSSSVTLVESEIKAFEKRDAEAEKIIRSLDGRIVHVAGLLHVYAGNYNNLFKRLADLSPKRMRLNAAGQKLR
ncbi:hypothetical protein J4479_04660 [Candidatus Woesearchaeota archaeon]|nr:hypothetical protein [Candidatus Woesearchaeota archaeon]